MKKKSNLPDINDIGMRDLIRENGIKWVVKTWLTILSKKIVDHRRKQLRDLGFVSNFYNDTYQLDILQITCEYAFHVNHCRWFGLLLWIKMAKGLRLINLTRKPK